MQINEFGKPRYYAHSTGCEADNSVRHVVRDRDTAEIVDEKESHAVAQHRATAMNAAA